MKRLLCIAIIIFLFLSGCASKAPEIIQGSQPLNELYKEVMSAPRGEYPPDQRKLKDIIDMDVEYGTIEDDLVSCTDIFKATYKSTRRVTRNYEDAYVHEFEVFEICRGTSTYKTIYVVFPIMHYLLNEIPYEPEKKLPVTTWKVYKCFYGGLYIYQYFKVC